MHILQLSSEIMIVEGKSNLLDEALFTSENHNFNEFN